MSLSVNLKPITPVEATLPVRPVASVAPIKLAVADTPVTPAADKVAADRTTENRSPSTSPETLEKALAAANQKFSSDGRELQFELDQDTNRTIVRLVDKSTQEVLRQFPSEVALRLARLASEGKSLHSILA